MGKRRQRQTRHAEGDHGPKTKTKIVKQLRSGPREIEVAIRVERERREAAFEGKRRLVEDRQQHDEGELASEHTRLFDTVRSGRDDGPSDNSGNLHGVLGHRGHRADYKQRGPNGLLRKRKH
jgi:hypothetical protein